MLNFMVRENMKSLSRFLLIALALMSYGAHASPVATTAGSNLTAYNSGFGATNNNNWNILTNPRTGADSAPTADFGNCNALILRCAQPKCKSGGCTDMDVTSAIVTGCVNSNETCKQYGAELINYISAQLVAQSTAKANQAAAAAQTASAQQNNQQMEKMAETISALQQQISESNANMQAALDAQQQSIASQIADAARPTPASSDNASTPVPTSDGVSGTDEAKELTTAQRIAAESGVPEDLILRADISGQILSKIEDAEKNLKTLEQTMNTAFEYAGCDKRGDNCTGPKRVKKFKDLAGEFFDPYEDVLDDLYEAILLGQTVGVDVSNIYMMLNNSCERWAKYACVNPMMTQTDKDEKTVYVWPRYSSTNCNQNTGKSIPGGMICRTYSSLRNECIGESLGSVRGGQECHIGQTIPPEDDTSCTLIEILSGNSEDKVARGYLYPEEGDMGDMVRVGCASNALKNTWLFRGKKQQASINIETLKRIVEQDNAQISFTRKLKNDLGERERVKYCALTETGYMNLQKYVGLRELPTQNICINERALNRNMDRVYVGETSSLTEMARNECDKKTGAAFSTKLIKCFCYDKNGKPVSGICSNDETCANSCDSGKSEKVMTDTEKIYCEQQYGGKYYGGTCDCSNAYDELKALCETRFDRPPSTTDSSTKIPLPGTCDLFGYDMKDCCQDRGGYYKDLCRCGGMSGTPMGTYDRCLGSNTLVTGFYSK